MKRIPTWLSDGLIVGIVGGQDYVTQSYKKLKSFDVKIAGVWMQDWVGQHKFPEGTRLLWNWSLNRGQYPGWDTMVSDWKAENVRTVVYLNPYLADL